MLINNASLTNVKNLQKLNKIVLIINKFGITIYGQLNLKVDMAYKLLSIVPKGLQIQNAKSKLIFYE
jgi:hypothetical protein